MYEQTACGAHTHPSCWVGLEEHTLAVLGGGCACGTICGYKSVPKGQFGVMLKAHGFGTFQKMLFPQELSLNNSV